MKTHLLLIAIVILAASWWLPRLSKNPQHLPTTPKQSAISSQRDASEAVTPAKENSPAIPPTSQPSQPAQDSEEQAQATRALLDRIHDASVTYDPQQLPVIAEFLLHENPEVRKAAIDGMIVLGDSAAAPLLRKAAASAPTPQEAVALEEAAAYMELPPASLPKKRQ